MKKTVKPPFKEIPALFQEVSRRHDIQSVFSDCLAMAAISISNRVDPQHYEEREKTYLQLAKKYTADELETFCKVLAQIVLELDKGYSDVLGQVFHELELHSKWKGQFFSPYTICQMMAKMTIGDGVVLKEKIETTGFITACEPACGSGAMVIAMAQEVKELGFNPSEHLHVTAVDVDLKCVHMAYIQLSLLGIPAGVVHGNALSLEEWSHWRTPASLTPRWERLLSGRPSGLLEAVKAA
jgi:type I restriction-modification system DNA methylase subunit